MAVHRENCTVLSTLSPELSQRIVPYVGDVEQRMKPQPTFCVSVKLWLLMHVFLGPLDPEDINP